MRHDYYYYSREELLKAPKLPIEILSDNQAVFQAIAQEMVDEIKRKNALGERTVFICPVGPVGQYPYFVDMVNQENISLKNVWFLNMDEYLTDDLEWIDHDHPLSFRGFMDRTVYTKLKPELVMPEEQRVFPDPKDPDCMGQLIAELGGVDICEGEGRQANLRGAPAIERTIIGQGVLSHHPDQRAAEDQHQFRSVLVLEIRPTHSAESRGRPDWS